MDVIVASYRDALAQGFRLEERSAATALRQEVEKYCLNAKLWR